MLKVTVDQAVGSRLGNLESRCELCDEQGRILGYFTPAQDRSLYEGVEPPIDEEALRARELEKERFNTQEVLDKLEQL